MLSSRLTFLISIVFLCGNSLLQAQDRPKNIPPSDEGGQVLTRGPIHEAFGKPVAFDPEPGLTISREIPPAIEEMPSEQKPAGDNVLWIPGYWGWDADRKDFIWISGFWRVMPPDHQWVAGYWNRLNGDYQWISGYWAPAGVAQAEYLPVPPDSLEAGPPTEAPSADHIWTPGCWIWHEARYVWRPGYWIEPNPGWVWTPAQYSWTPSGCIFVDGYWDHSPRRRGLLFAPVFFDRRVYTRPRFVYSPRIFLDVDILTDHFFVHPRYHHYCFGDYYASSFLTIGIYPWFSFHHSRYGYDPFFAYYDWHYRRRDSGWHDRLREDYRHRRDNREARPPRTFEEQQQASVRADGRRERLALAKSLSQVSKAEDSDIRLERVSEERRRDLAVRAKEVREGINQRARLESEAAAKLSRRERQETRRALKLDLPKNTVSAGKVKKTEDAPPRPKQPKIDPDFSTKRKPEARPRPEERLERAPRERRLEEGQRRVVPEKRSTERLRQPERSETERKPARKPDSAGRERQELRRTQPDSAPRVQRSEVRPREGRERQRSVERQRPRSEPSEVRRSESPRRPTRQLDQSERRARDEDRPSGFRRESSRRRDREG